jgi:cell division protein FtsB
MNYWGTICKLAWGIVVVVIIFGVIGLFMPRCNRLTEMQKKRARFEKENRKLEKNIDNLREKQRLFKTDPEFVKRVARENGRVSPDETVYKEATNEASREKMSR